MSDKVLPAYLSVASSFTAADYPYFLSSRLRDPKDHIARARSLTSMRNAANSARITDYKLFEEYDRNTIYLRTPKDVTRFKVATSPGDSIMEEFVRADRNIDIRKLKRICNLLQNMTDTLGFGNTILFGLDRRERCIYFEASSKSAYYDFDDLVEENRQALQPILSLQRKEADFDIPFPTEQEATPTRITYEGENTVEAPADEVAALKSIGVTIGGADKDAEKSKDRSHLSLIKSFEPLQHGYRYKLTPSIVFDPERSQSDNLFRYHLDYPDFKKAKKAEWVTEQIRHAMKLAETEDYYLNNGPNGIEAWFKEPQDLAVSYAAISPDTAYQVDFLHCSRQSSPMKMNTKAKKLQAIFAETGEKVHVRFVPDMERRVIQIVTNCADDFIRIQGITRRLEKTHDQFQQLVGLKISR